MARPLRLEFARALSHVTSRGDGREDIVQGFGEYFGLHDSRISKIIRDASGRTGEA
jgi:hypothetical protein